jgi:hypothetical protein
LIGSPKHREDAGRHAFDKEAETVEDNAELRDSYLALALEYERLAVILENRTSAGRSSMGQ